MKPYPDDNHIFPVLHLCVAELVWADIVTVACDGPDSVALRSLGAQERICCTVTCNFCTSESNWERACVLCVQSAYSRAAESRAGNSSKTRLEQPAEAFLLLYIYPLMGYLVWILLLPLAISLPSLKMNKNCSAQGRSRSPHGKKKQKTSLSSHVVYFFPCTQKMF